LFFFLFSTVEGRNLSLEDPLPLHFSVYTNRPRCSELFIAQGAPLNALEKGSDWSPLHFAAYLNDEIHLRLLKQKGANLNIKGGTHGVIFDEI
jgi:ankyrin repeat protein